MNKERNEVVSAALLGVAGGAAIGATLGILFAPNKGAVTRKQIARKGRDAAMKVKDEIEDIQDAFKR